MKKRELSLILCLPLVCDGVALAYLPFVLPVYTPILLINACPQFWLGKKVTVFGILQAVGEQWFVRLPYDYVLRDPVVGTHIGVELNILHILIWPYIDVYDGAYVMVIGILREGLPQSTFTVESTVYYIERTAITIIKSAS